MCEQAVLEAFDKKWFRRDYLATVEKYGGVSRAELSRAARLNNWNPRLEVVNSIALEMEQRVEDLVEGETDDLDLEPVSVFYRIDGISMKRRELSNCCPMHQAFGHLAVIGLRPLLRAKLLPYQFASIPGKGQIALKRQVERWLRRKSLGIQHAVKLDVQGAYAHTKQAVVMDILRREIPGATWLLAVINCLLAMAPGRGTAHWRIPRSVAFQPCCQLYAGKGVKLCKDSPRSIYAVCDPQRQLYGRPCSTWATMGRYTKCGPEID